MGKPHVLAIPYPAQGHVIPLMELMQRLAKQGFRITFVNTDFNHKRVINALSEEDNVGDMIRLVSIPDGLDPSEDRNELGILSEAIFRVMPEKLQELIEKTNAADDMAITCIIADASMGWAMELIDDGIINNNGTPIKNQMIQLSPTMPPMNTAQFGWACIGDLTTQKQIFDLTVKCNEFITLADWIVSSSAYELESAAFTLFPNILPIGPLLASNRLGKQSGYFWPEDTTCLSWLDQRPPCSVIYVAFGSFTVFDQTQFQELALGLELTRRPFLWVVRPDITVELGDSYPQGFEDSVSIRGRMVGWAPQQKVLSHPSVACFLSHCGWNSTMEERTKMGNPHVLVIPYPAQGHVLPLMELAQCLAKHGFKITFVNTENTHKRVVDALEGKDTLGGQFSLVSISDGLEPGERHVPGKLSAAIFRVMPGKIEELIQESTNKSEDDKITCIIADQSFGWAMEVGVKMGIQRVAFHPAAAAILALGFSIPKLIDDGIINNDGTPTKNKTIQLSANMPAINTGNFVWNRLGAFTIAPDITPIGPLLASNRLGNSAGHFWTEDTSCLKWLDQQPACSVIYVAFGSFTVLNQSQFEELALGLELTNRPFLWVVRPEMNGQDRTYPEGFLERIEQRAQMVSWAPQQKVLSHPSVACFLSHCGWNSTIEGVSNGVPILSWPYFVDQFINETYICDVWKVGLGFEKDEKGIIARAEIRNKVEQLLGNNVFRERALELKETVMTGISQGGSSNKNFTKFIEWLKA
ncbi:hypothetical protein RJ639_036807 [Escallonia herrerae]|uniref:UDP-glycosyltransferase n=1 Tax=Escallonia herrerae TaxID=1293975 RepID=A0AA88WRB8_9ASTE|nr:hypothetical protein RJ639_036807 [Escallonia herrerae]